MSKVSILHISDLHLSEGLFDNYNLVPGLTGHDLTIFEELTNKINELDFDLLIISGDLSRSGHLNSFFLVKNWLEGSSYISEYRQMGLRLSDRKIPYSAVPGNHDYYTKKSIIQKDNDNYNSFFKPINVDAIDKFEINGIKVNIHMYDSCKKFSIALGDLKENHKISKNLKDDELDIAVLHHHILLPPNEPRDRNLELLDIRNDANYLLSCGFNAILFGHTHTGFVDCISDNLIIKLFPEKRGFTRTLRNLQFSRIVKLFENENTSVSYKREKAQNGQFPTFSAYMEYLLLKIYNNCNVLSPSSFQNIDQFYKHLEERKNKLNLKPFENQIFNKKTIISMAPSACQYNAKKQGFNRITFDLKNNSAKTEEYVYEDKKFVLYKVREHMKLIP